METMFIRMPVPRCIYALQFIYMLNLRIQLLLDYPPFIIPSAASYICMYVDSSCSSVNCQMANAVPVAFLFLFVFHTPAHTFCICKLWLNKTWRTNASNRMAVAGKKVKAQTVGRLGNYVLYLFFCFCFA